MHGVQPAAKAIPSVSEPKMPRGFSLENCRVSRIKIFDLEQPDQMETENDDHQPADNSHPGIADDFRTQQSRSAAEY